MTVHLPVSLDNRGRRETEVGKTFCEFSTNTSTNVRVTVRNTLLTEVPLTSELSITACETMISFARPLILSIVGKRLSISVPKSN